MQPIIVSSEKLKYYEEIRRLCEYAGYEQGVTDSGRIYFRMKEFTRNFYIIWSIRIFWENIR